MFFEHIAPPASTNKVYFFSQTKEVRRGGGRQRKYNINSFQIQDELCNNRYTPLQTIPLIEIESVA